MNRMIINRDRKLINHYRMSFDDAYVLIEKSVNITTDGLSGIIEDNEDDNWFNPQMNHWD